MSSFETRLLGEADQLIATCLQLNACLPLEARTPQSTWPSPRQLSPPPPSLYSVHTLPPPSPLPSSAGWHQPCCHQLISKKRLFSSGSRFVEHRVTQKVFRGHTDLNHGPIGLQPIALPLSYIPKWCYILHCLSHLCWHWLTKRLLRGSPGGVCRCAKYAVTRIRTWVTAATTQGPNH